MARQGGLPLSGHGSRLTRLRVFLRRVCLKGLRVEETAPATDKVHRVVPDVRYVSSIVPHWK